MTDETKLLPCPFCGGEAKQRTLTEDEFGNEGADVIECSQCCASSHIEFGRKENLVSAWNTRALVSTLVAECDDLRAQLADARENARWAYVQAALEDNQEALTEANARADRAEAALAAIDPAPVTPAEAAKVLLADKAALATLVNVAEEEHDKGVWLGAVIGRALRAVERIEA